LVAIRGDVSASFQYDGFGRRVSKTIGGTTQFLYDGFAYPPGLHHCPSDSPNCGLSGASRGVALESVHLLGPDLSFRWR
jgi:hypothetical protein